MTKLPVVAAVTNYNMAAELERLLPQVVKQGYDAIFVLDDASSDNSRAVVSKFKDVMFVAGKTNKGAGANRNRIIKALTYDALIHFLDADVILETEHTADLVRKVAPDKPFGFVGGLIKSRSGKQHVWNYGSGAGLRSGLGAQLQTIVAGPLLDHNPKAAARLRRVFKKLLAYWPDPSVPPKRCLAYWCAEANMVMRSDIFAQLGGYDENLRETEILELAMRMQRQGLPCYFDPRISVVHTEGKVRFYNRDVVKLKELLRAARQYGLLKWIVADGAPKAK
jgi:GT2 family glycosyltransferase